MAGFEHLIKSYNVRDLLDDIASSDPPAYLKRCFAEGISVPQASWPRIQQLAVCAMVLDAIINDRDYEFLEHELISDWRLHYRLAFGKLKDVAIETVHRIRERDRPDDPEAASELDSLEQRLMGG